MWFEILLVSFYSNLKNVPTFPEFGLEVFTQIFIYQFLLVLCIYIGLNISIYIELYEYGGHVYLFKYLYTLLLVWHI